MIWILPHKSYKLLLFYVIAFTQLILILVFIMQNFINCYFTLKEYFDGQLGSKHDFMKWLTQKVFFDHVGNVPWVFLIKKHPIGVFFYCICTYSFLVIICSQTLADSSETTIVGRALKFSQNVGLMYTHCRKEFVDLDFDIDIDKSWYLHISINIAARALKFSQIVDLIKTFLLRKFVDLNLDIDIDIDKSWYLHISMNIDARALQLSQNVDLVKTLLWKSLVTLTLILILILELINLDIFLSPWILMLELWNFHSL